MSKIKVVMTRHASQRFFERTKKDTKDIRLYKLVRDTIAENIELFDNFKKMNLKLKDTNLKIIVKKEKSKYIVLTVISDSMYKENKSNKSKYNKRKRNEAKCGTD